MYAGAGRPWYSRGWQKRFYLRQRLAAQARSQPNSNSKRNCYRDNSCGTELTAAVPRSQIAAKVKRAGDREHHPCSQDRATRENSPAQYEVGV